MHLSGEDTVRMAFVLKLHTAIFLFLWVLTSFTSAQKTDVNKPTYEILGSEVVTAAEGLRAITQVRVKGDTIPSQEDLKKIGISIWNAKNQMWSEFTIFFFLEEMNVDASAYAIARYNPSGFQAMTLQAFSLKDTRYVNNKPAVVVAPPPRDTTPKVSLMEYDVALSAKKHSPHRILITATTNLPDNTLVNVVVSRPYLKQGDENEQLGQIFKRVVSVKNGSIELNDTVVDYKWYTLLLDTKRKEGGGADASFTGFKSISPRVIVDLSFSTSEQTSSAVVAKLGKTGEKMGGTIVVKNPTGATILRSAVTEIEFQK